MPLPFERTLPSFEERAERNFFQNIAKAKDQAYKKLDKPKNHCEDLFAAIGVVPQDALAVLLGSNYEDGTKAMARISDVMGAPVRGMEDWTIADLFLYGTPPLPSTTRVDWFSPPGGTIYLRPSAVSWEVMAHEALHQFAGLDDETILARLAAKYGDDPNKGGVDPHGYSSQITDKIREKCN